MAQVRACAAPAVDPMHVKNIVLYIVYKYCIVVCTKEMEDGKGDEVTITSFVCTCIAYLGKLPSSRLQSMSILVYKVQFICSLKWSGED